MAASENNANSSFVGARLSAEYVINSHENGSPMLSVYGGAGADLILENDRNIALPQIELALRFRFGNGDNNNVVLSDNNVISDAPPVILNEVKNLNDNIDSSQARNDREMIEEKENLNDNIDSSPSPLNDSMREIAEQQARTEPSLRRIADQVRNDREAIVEEETPAIVEEKTSTIVEAETTPVILNEVKNLNDNIDSSQALNDIVVSNCLFPIALSQPPSYSAIIYFDTETAEPIGDYKQTLDNIGAILTSDTKQRALIRGYAEPTGAQETRISVSQKRAEFTRDYITNNFNINADRIAIKALADCKPDTADPTEPIDKRSIAKFTILKTEKEQK